eukprot:9121955-Pyramimonas_sp.AAC.1
MTRGRTFTAALGVADYAPALAPAVPRAWASGSGQLTSLARGLLLGPWPTCPCLAGPPALIRAVAAAAPGCV